MIYVFGGDYAAVEFEKYFKGKSISEIIREYFVEDKEYDGDFEMEVIEFDEVDPKFIKFLKKEFLDYDLLKNTNFYLEDQIVK
jgi:hypothetical protein